MSLRIEADDWFGYQTLRLDFADLRSVAITGPNDHGKSAITDALTFGIWGEIGSRPGINSRSADRFIRHGTDSFLLKVAFTTTDGQEVLVTREKHRGQAMVVNLYVDDVLKSGGIIKETQARIDGLIGLDFEGITATNVALQRDMGRLMNADPRHRKDLLIQYLGLDQFEPLHKAAKAEADEAAADLKSAEANVARLEDVITDAEPLRAQHAEAAGLLATVRTQLAMAEEQRSDLRERYATAKAAKDRLTAEWAAAKLAEADREAATDIVATMAEKIAEADRAAREPEPRVQMPEMVPAGAIEDAEQIRDAARLQIAERDRIADALQTLVGRANEAIERRALVDVVPCGAVGIYATCPLLTGIPTLEDIEATGASIDRTTTRLVALEGKATEAAEAEAERQRLVVAEAYYTRAKNGAATVRRDWAQRVAAARDLAASRRETLATAQSALERLTTGPTPDVAYTAAEEAGAALGALLAAGEAIRVQVERLRGEAATHEATERDLDRRMAVIGDAERQIGGWRDMAAEAKERGAIYSALADAWHRDGVPTEMIERAIPVMESKANEILARLPEELTLVMRTQKPTKGGMAETFDIIVTIAGVEQEYGMFSWGARLRIDVALRLALAEVNAHRSGQRVDWLWFDEPLSDLDTEGVEAMLELLATIRDDFQPIVVVSHHPTFSDALETQIDVLKDEATQIIEARLAA